MTTEMKARDKVVNFIPVLLVLYFVWMFTVVSVPGVALKKG